MTNRRTALTACLTGVVCIVFAGNASSNLGPAPNPPPEPILFSQDPDDPSPEIGDLVRTVAEAKTAKDARNATAKLFKGADRKKLEDLKQIKEDAVALRAAWREMLLSGTPRTAKHPELGPVKVVEKAAGTRFLGFVEGRLRITVPKWWEECATEAYRIDDDQEVLFAGDPGSPYDQNKKPPFAVTKGVSLRMINGKLFLRCGKDDVELSQEVAEKHVFGQQHLSVLHDRDSIFLAPHTFNGYSFPLVCLDRASGAKKWEAKVWGEAIDAAAVTGPSFQFASIIAKENRVFVFGDTCGCCFVEAFDRKTGRNLFRFAND